MAESFFRNLGGLAKDWVDIKRRRLQNRKPQTEVDSGGSVSNYNWQGQDLDRNDLRKVKEIRESGGLVCWLFDVKATMRFGTGAELQAEEDDLEKALNEDLFRNLDLTVLELGRDATWYPYGLAEFRETRGNGFAHLEFVEPWTVMPQTDKYGDILGWEQQTQQMTKGESIAKEEIGYITLSKSSARDKVGVSEVLRNEEEITQYKQNQEAVNQALEIAAYPHHVWKVGAEGRTPINDNDLRRVRNLVDNMDGDTQFVLGRDIDHDQITPAEFDFESITKRDLRILTTSVGLPMELAGYGREGMGSGSESRLIMDMLALQNETARRQFEVQFIEQFVRPVVERYTDFDSEQNINLQINPFLDEREGMASLIKQVGEYMSNSEIRDRLDLPPLEDEDMAEAYRSPQQIEEAEEGDQQDEGPFGGMLQKEAEDAVENELSNRELQEIEEIDTEPPEGVQEQARMALDWKEETGNPNDCGTRVGWERANQLDNGESLSEDTINRMVSFFARHEHDQEPDESKEDCSRMMWKAWGGDAGKDWAESKQAEFEEAREASDSGNVNLAGEDTPDWDRHYLNMLENVAWAENTDRTLLSGSGVPDMVQTRLRDVILSGTLFEDIESIPSSDRMQLREFMLETLTDKDGWTTDELTDQIQQLGVDRDRAEMIARTETSAAVNSAREQAYEERELEDDRFKWVGVNDNRTTEACTWLKEKTNPKFGGSPVTLEELKELIAEAPEHDPDMQDNMARPEEYTAHINERHTFVRHVE